MRSSDFVNRSYDCLPFSLSIQQLTAFAMLSSYGKRDFAEAEGRKTEIGERYTRLRGSGRVKKFHTGPERRNLAKETENQRRFA